MNDTRTPTFEYTDAHRIAVLIPAYEPDAHLIETVRAVRKTGSGPIVVVNDGSAPSCASIFDALAPLGVFVCHHNRNLGKGAALKTGIRYITEHFPDCLGIVTADADGQHAAADIHRVAARTAQTADALVLGVRDFGQENVPWNSRMGNRITSAIFWLITRIRCLDTQTGLRGIPNALFPLALSTEGTRYEYEMNFLLNAAEQKSPIDMVQIQTIYLDDNRSSHFRIFRDSFLIYRRPITFLLSALSSSLVDLSAFYLFFRLLFQEDRTYLFFASALARLLSGCVNFLLNKKLTFRSRGNTWKESIRYLCLFSVVLLLSSTSVALLGWLPVPALLIKVVVDSALFFMNYIVQRTWVFSKNSGGL